MSNETHWKCGDGNEKNPLKYTGCGLDEVWLRNGYEITDNGYGPSLSITNIEGLHKVIGLYLVTSRKVLSPKELKFLRKQMELTQAELGRGVRLSDQQVARWEKGEQPITETADALLRLLYLGQVIGKVNPSKFLAELEKTDDVGDGRVVFDEFEGEWHAKEAA